MAGGRKLPTGSRALIFNDDEVAALLRAAIEREGSQSAFARRYGVNRSYMNRSLKGKASLSPKLHGFLDFAKCTLPTENMRGRWRPTLRSCQS